MESTEPELLTWDNLTCFDDLVLPEERRLILRLESKNGRKVCPSLGKLEKFFRYCRKGIPEWTQPELKPDNPFYRAHKGVVELQLWCEGCYEKCCVYTEQFTPPGAILSK